jgi:hypothetical protein
VAVRRSSDGRTSRKLREKKRLEVEGLGPRNPASVAYKTEMRTIGSVGGQSARVRLGKKTFRLTSGDFLGSKVVERSQKAGHKSDLQSSEDDFA